MEQRHFDETRFSQSFAECCAADIRAVRAELLQRLTPAEKVQDESSYWTMAMEDRRGRDEPTYRPMPVRDYASKFRYMGLALLHRNEPEGISSDVLFTTLKFPTTSGDSHILATPYGLQVAMGNEAPLGSGYLILQMDADPGSSSLRWNDNHVSSSRDEKESSNRALTQYLAEHNDAATIICLKLDETRFTSKTPLTAYILSHNPVKIASVKFFGE